MIILEGMDGSGKSSLADRLRNTFNLEVTRSKGPIRTDEDRDERFVFYNSLPHNMVVDRHPMISGAVYQFHYPLSFIPVDMIPDLSQHLLIYCKSPNTNIGDQHGDWDTPEYVESLKVNREAIIKTYDRVMRGLPHINYTWDNLDDILHDVWAYLK